MSYLRSRAKGAKMGKYERKLEEDQKKLYYRTLEELVEMKRSGSLIKKVSPLGLKSEEYGHRYRVDGFIIHVSEPPEEIERRLKAISKESAAKFREEMEELNRQYALGQIGYSTYQKRRKRIMER